MLIWLFSIVSGIVHVLTLAINALNVLCMILALVLDAKYCNGILLRLHMSI